MHTPSHTLIHTLVHALIHPLAHPLTPTTGSLHRLLRDVSQQQLLTWPNKLQWAKDIAEGIKYLHENRILHGDIKSHNMYGWMCTGWCVYVLGGVYVYWVVCMCTG